MKKLVFGFILSVFTLTFAGCSEEIDESTRFVFHDPVITEYLSKHEEYSEYNKLLKAVPLSDLSETTAWQLLSARGHYTVFAPTNEAIQEYLDTLAANGLFLTGPSWDAFTDSVKLDSIRQAIVFNSIINSGDDHECYYTYDFPATQDAELPIANMYDSKLFVSRVNNELLINNSLIDEKKSDIPMTNGTVHTVRNVVMPSSQTLGNWLSKNAKDKRPGFYVSSLLVMAVGLIDTLDVTEDYTYRKLVEAGRVKGNRGGPAPEHRYYGFTFFAEPDEVWSKALGKPALEITVDDVMKYLTELNVYPEAKRDKNYKSEENLLNQFVTYHLLNRRIQTDKLVMHYNEYGYDFKTKELGCAFSEYYYTMGKRRLMKIYESKECNGIYLNRCPKLDNGPHGTNHEVSCPPGREGVRVGTTNRTADNDMRNAMVYPIDKILLYDTDTRTNLGRERIRFDVISICPEMMNNDIRMSTVKAVNAIPSDVYYRYSQDMSASENTEFVYSPAYLLGWPNYDGDEANAWGIQDITYRLPPVPTKNIYELRFGCSNLEPHRGMFQIYCGTDPTKLQPTGIPMDLRMGGITYSNNGRPSYVGWESDREDDAYNAEVDKKMHNSGFMKAPKVFYSGSAGAAMMARENNALTRRVIVRQMMDPDKTYYLRFKSCLDDTESQFYHDYFEMCPKEVYDNPETPEDIW